MSVNRGKQFEDIIKKSFEQVKGVSIDRLHDQTTHWKGSTNICDFIVYKRPYQYYIECKSTNASSFYLENITDTQWRGLKEKSLIPGVFAGVIVWYVQKDITVYLPIQFLQYHLENGWHGVSLKRDLNDLEFNVERGIVFLSGKKKRVFFEYDMKEFFDAVFVSKVW